MLSHSVDLIDITHVHKSARSKGLPLGFMSVTLKEIFSIWLLEDSNVSIPVQVFPLCCNMYFIHCIFFNVIFIFSMLMLSRVLQTI